tara:strand:+ start:21608 stop:24061 length:2454 start_codon:yes stop_codon:yes gene_type:complete
MPASKSLVSTILAFVLALGIIDRQAAADDSPAQSAGEVVNFASEVQPILAKKCYACHGPDEAEGGLKFIDQESALAETDSGEYAIVPGDIQASVLIARITSDDEYERMPPEGDPVAPEEIALLKRWIEQGATWTKHWAFEPMRNDQPPTVANPDWQSNGIDAFIFHSLAENRLAPNPPADPAALVRRVYYDLIGLPPTVQQVQEFVDSDDPQAYEHLVDELLDSPHYGERWGRHWLDLVRFAETNSFERDGTKVNAWKYRDYVIKSFNDDKPYDRFVREQLAGDELDDVTVESLTATGYYRLGIWDDEPADPLQSRYDELDDIITTTGQAFLALTINCARCHDHKIDPIPQTDYYSMLSFLEDLTTFGERRDKEINNQIDVSSEEIRELYSENARVQKAIEQEMYEIEQAGIAKMDGVDQRATEGAKKDRKRVLEKKLRSHLEPQQWDRYRELKKQATETTRQYKTLPPRETVMGIAKYREIKDPTFVLFRGNPHSPADEVSPRFPTLFGVDSPSLNLSGNSRGSSGRRRVLADWIASENNMLTARVMANRLWQFHFGRGIVRSSNNFGQLGTPPTHPELLDWLAQQLIKADWKLKPMHRLIMSSHTYRMSSAGRDDALAIDPSNDLFWRFDPRRLSAEEVRDSFLAINGSLNRKVYGPSIYPQLSQEVLAGQSKPGSGWGKSSRDEQNRRSVYIHVKRSLLTPMLSAFDFPDPDLTCEARFATLQPGQALSLLNSEFVHEQAARLANSINAADGPNEDVVRNTIRAVLSRDAAPKEVERGCQLIDQLQQEDGVGRERAVQLYCLSVLNWNEFLFID